MNTILKMIELGAGVKNVIDEFNKTRGSEMRSKYFYNLRRKTNVKESARQTSNAENENFKKIIDSIRSNPENEFYIRVEEKSNLMESCFIVFEEQKNW